MMFFLIFDIARSTDQNSIYFLNAQSYIDVMEQQILDLVLDLVLVEPSYLNL
jgi:hypothetical protein